MIQPPSVGPRIGAEQGGNGEERHGRALLFGRKGVEQHPLRAGLQAAAGQTLDHAKQNQLLQAGRHAAQPRGQREDGDRQQKVVPAAEMRGQPTRDRQDDRVGGQVAGDDPFAVDHGRRQTAGDVRSATLAIVVSSTSMKVGTTTAAATIQGLIAGARRQHERRQRCSWPAFRLTGSGAAGDYRPAIACRRWGPWPAP